MRRVAYDNGFIGILDGIFKCVLLIHKNDLLWSEKGLVMWS